MSHDHHNDGHHKHHTTELSVPEKIVKLLDHWIKHNHDHAETYQDWAGRARQNQLEEVARLIEDAADINLMVNKKFEQAKAMIMEKK